MNKKQKALIIQALLSESSPSYWGRQRVADYLRQLKDKGFSDIKVTYDRELRHNRILDWIKNADPKLTIFLEKNQNAERSRKQTSELLTLPDNLIKDIKKHVAKDTEIPYDAFKSGNWKQPEIVYLTRIDDTVEIWLATRVGRSDGEKTKWSSLSKEVQKSLSSTVKKNDIDIIEFQSVYLEYNIYGRVINIITIDLNTNQASIKSDEKKYLDPDDSEEKRVQPEERFTDTLQTAFSSIGVQLDKKEVRKIREAKRITKDSVSKIHAI